MRKSFIVHIDSLCILDDLTDEQAGKLFKAIRNYQNGVESDMDSLTKIAFAPFKNQFARDEEKYINRSQINSLNGKKGGRGNKANESKESELLLQKANKADSDSKSKSDSDSKNKSISKNKTYTIEERKINFAHSLKPFLNIYGKDMLNAFYHHWTEHGENDKKMRFEKERTFGISQRLVTWKRNKRKFGGESKTDNLRTAYSSALEKMGVTHE